MWDWVSSIVGSLGEFLGYELLGTTISILELLISFASLFAGGYYGTRSGAISRMRVDDRRRLLDEILPKILELSAPDPEDRGDRAAELTAHLEVARDVVELLPWLDRSEWKTFDRLEVHRVAAELVTARRRERFADSLVEDHNKYRKSSQEELGEAEVALDVARRSRRPHDIEISEAEVERVTAQLDSAVERLERSTLSAHRRSKVMDSCVERWELVRVQAHWRFESETEYRQTYNAFLRHLRYQLRPSFLRRWVLRWRTWRLVWPTIRSWERWPW